MQSKRPWMTIAVDFGEIYPAGLTRRHASASHRNSYRWTSPSTPVGNAAEIYEGRNARMTHRITSSAWFVAIPGRSDRDNKVAMGLVSERVQPRTAAARVPWQSASSAAHLVEIIISRGPCSSSREKVSYRLEYNYERSFAPIRGMNTIQCRRFCARRAQPLLLLDRRDLFSDEEAMRDAAPHRSRRRRLDRLIKIIEVLCCVR